MEGGKATEVLGLVAGASDGVATIGAGGDEIGAAPVGGAANVAGAGTGASLRNVDGPGADLGAAPGACAEMRNAEARRRRAKIGRRMEAIAIAELDSERLKIGRLLGLISSEAWRVLVGFGNWMNRTAAACCLYRKLRRW